MSERLSAWLSDSTEVAVKIVGMNIKSYVQKKPSLKDTHIHFCGQNILIGNSWVRM